MEWRGLGLYPKDPRLEDPRFKGSRAPELVNIYLVFIKIFGVFRTLNEEKGPKYYLAEGWPLTPFGLIPLLYML